MIDCHSFWDLQQPVRRGCVAGRWQHRWWRGWQQLTPVQQGQSRQSSNHSAGTLSSRFSLIAMKGNLRDGDLMLICITPDQDGKFGFNVKVGFTRLMCLLSLHMMRFLFPWLFIQCPHQGGVDQKMPLAISHVKPDSPVRRNALWCLVFPASAITTGWRNPVAIWT